MTEIEARQLIDDVAAGKSKPLFDVVQALAIRSKSVVDEKLIKLEELIRGAITKLP